MTSRKSSTESIEARRSAAPNSGRFSRGGPSELAIAPAMSARRRRLWILATSGPRFFGGNAGPAFDGRKGKTYVMEGEMEKKEEKRLWKVRH